MSSSTLISNARAIAEIVRIVGFALFPVSTFDIETVGRFASLEKASCESFLLSRSSRTRSQNVIFLGLGIYYSVCIRYSHII